MKDMPALQIDIENREIRLCLLLSDNQVIPLSKLQIIPVLLESDTSFAHLKHHKFSIYDKIMICQCSQVSEQTQKVVVTLKLTEFVLALQEYEVNYATREAKLVACSYLLTKNAISERWKIQPLFLNKKSMYSAGLVIYHWPLVGGWQEVIHLENFKDEDFLAITDVGKAGYKVYGDTDLRKASSLFLHCRVDPQFAEEIGDSHDLLDRLLKSLSNLAPNLTNFTVQEHIDDLIDKKRCDFLALSENLYGRPAASVLTSDEINKMTVFEKQEGCLSILHLFLEDSQYGTASTLCNLGLRGYNELAEDFSLQTPVETALYDKNFPTFELLFNFCCQNGNPNFVYKVIMRNLDIIMTLPELDKVMENFFQEDLSQGNPVTFGMRLGQEDLPEYQNRISFRGLNKEEG